MKKILLQLLVMSLSLANAQQNQGRVVYNRTMQMQLNMNDNDQVSQMLPKTRIDKFELTFGNNKSIWKHIDEEDNADEVNGNGMQIKMITPGQNDVVFCDFNKGIKTAQRELMGRQFIITDSLHPLDWKVSAETQILLGHVCQKATAIRQGKRTQMTMSNGNIERKEIADTSTITAWFTTEIPVPAGPEVQGQLPGLILSIEINNGRITYNATELSGKADMAAIKEPTTGKKVTPVEYVKETARMMDEMKKNNEGNNTRKMHIDN